MTQDDDELLLVDGEEIDDRGVTPAPAAPRPSSFQRKLPMHLGRYTLERHLGTGGMAEVFLASTFAGGVERKVVVKVLLQHLAAREKYVAMFEREATLAARVSHPNLVQVLEFAIDDATPYIVMEYVDGIGLHQLARRAWSHKRSVPLELCANAIADAALGLAAAHRAGLVHRDISPDNLMITKEGITKVLDFGIAKSADSESFTKTGEIKGKVPFMAPEMIRGDDPDPRVDIYALGVTLYWLVTGQRPFKGPNEVAILQSILNDTPPRPSAVNASLPDPVERLILAMIEKEPALRAPSMDAVHHALEWSHVARTSVVVPFVEQMLLLPDSSAGSDTPTTDGFFPSQPSLDIVKSMDLTAVPTPFRPTTATAGTGAPPGIETRPLRPRGAPSRRLAAALAGVAALAVLGVVLMRDPVTRDPAPDVIVTPPPPTPPQPTPPQPPVTPPPVAAPVPPPVETPPVEAPPAPVKPPTKKPTATKVSTEKGKLQVRAFPFAEVSIDGKVVGTTPFPDVDVPAGKHTVTLRYEKKVEKRTITIRPKQTERVTVRFE